MSSVDLLELYHLGGSPYYILNDDNTLRQVSFEHWMHWHAQHRERTFVSYTEVGTRIVSTIFTGIGSSWGSGPFETLIAHDGRKGVVANYPTYQTALEGHDLWVTEITRSALENSN